MTKEEALYKFWASFGLPAYDESTVPVGADMPRITYQVVTDSFGSSVPLSASVWYRSYSWVEINQKTAQIADKIGRGGIILHCDNGAIWLKKGSPFAQSMAEPSDDAVRRKNLNLTVEYITAE